MKKYVFICGAVISVMLAFVGCLQPATTQVDVGTELNAGLASNYVSSVPKTDEDNQNLVSLGSGMTVGGIIEEHEAQALREEQAAKDALVNACISSANEVFAGYVETVASGDIGAVEGIKAENDSSAREVVVALVEEGGSRDEGCTAYLEVIFDALVTAGFTVDESFYSAQGTEVEEETETEAEAEAEEEATETEAEAETTEEETEDTPTTTESTSSTTPSTSTSSTTPSTSTSSTTPSTSTSSTTPSTSTSSTTTETTGTTETTDTSSTSSTSSTSTTTTNNSIYSATNPWKYTTAEIQEFPTYSIKGELITTGNYVNSSENTSNNATGSTGSTGATGTTGTTGSTGSDESGWDYSTSEIQNFPTYSITGELITTGGVDYLGGDTTSSATSSATSSSTNSNSWWSGSVTPSTSSTTSSSTNSNGWWSGSVIPSTSSSSSTSSTSSSSTSWWSGNVIPSTSSGSTSSNTNQIFPSYSLTGGTTSNNSGTVDGFTTFIFPNGDTGYNPSSTNDNVNNGTTYYIDYAGNGYNNNYTGATDGSIYIDYSGSNNSSFSGYNGSNTTYINYTGTGYTSDYTENGNNTVSYQGPTNVLPNTSYISSSDSYIIIQPNTTDYTFSGAGNSVYTSSQHTLIPYSGSMEDTLSSLYLNYNDGATTGITTNNGSIYVYPQY